METTIKISGFEDKTSAKGRGYTSFITDNGRMNCFESDIIETLKKQPAGQPVMIDMAESGNFKNIRAIKGIPDEVEVVKPASEPAGIMKPIYNAEANKQAGVSTRFAVDLCVAGKIKLEDIEKTAGMLKEFMSNIAKLN